jgi:hypothetical protein
LPVAVPWERARYAPPATDALYVLYRDLEFKSLLARLPEPEEAALFARDDAEAVRGTYRTFVPSTDPPEFALLAGLLRELAGAERVGIAFRGDDEIGVSGAVESGLRVPSRSARAIRRRGRLRGLARGRDAARRSRLEGLAGVLARSRLGRRRGRRARRRYDDRGARAQPVAHVREPRGCGG